MCGSSTRSTSEVSADKGVSALYLELARGSLGVSQSNPRGWSGEKMEKEASQLLPDPQAGDLCGQAKKRCPWEDVSYLNGQKKMGIFFLWQKYSPSLHGFEPGKDPRVTKWLSSV